MRNRQTTIATRLSPSKANRKLNRHGLTALIAMLYVALIASLAVGFYASTNSAAMVTENEKRGNMSLVACESGMDFLRFHLAQLTVPHGVGVDSRMHSVSDQLKSQLENTGNFGSKTISLTGTTISIPSKPDEYIMLDPNGGSFRATITDISGGGEDGKVLVKITGRNGGYESKRAVQMEFVLNENPSKIFDYGLATKGGITTAGAARIRGATDPTKGSILTTSTAANPVTINGKEVSGDISVAGGGAVNFGGGASIGGTDDPALIVAQHIHKGVEAPEFPTIDTDAFKAYATTLYTGGTDLVNVRIPANTNPKFNGGVNIKGVLYIETPNTVTFNGSVNIQGVIVTQNNPLGNLSTNILNFSGNVSAQPVNTLDASFGDLRLLTGSFLLASGFQANFTGNFGVVNGAIVADKVSFGGNAGGTVMGSIVNLTNNPLTVSGTSDVIIASTGTTNYPAGVYFSNKYAVNPGSYQEVKP
jgi:hypothetical protein